MIQLIFFNLVVRRAALARFPGGEAAFLAMHAFDQQDDALLVRVAMAVSDLQDAWDALIDGGLLEGEDFVVIDIGGAQMAASDPIVAPFASQVPWLDVSIQSSGRATAAAISQES